MQIDLKDSISRSLMNFGYLTFSKVTMQVLNLVVVTVVIWRIGAPEYGKMSIFLMVTQFAYLLVAGWNAVGYTKFAVTFNSEGGTINDVFWARTATVLMASIPVLCILVVFRQQFADYLELPQVVLTMIVLHWLSRITMDYTVQMSQVVSRFKKISVIQVVEKCIILLIVWLAGNELQTILWIYIGVTLVCRGYYLLTADSSFYSPVQFNYSLCKRLLNFSYPLVIVSVGSFIFAWVDIAIIKHYSAFSEVGVYSLAYTGFSAVESMLFLMPTILTPILVSIAARNRQDLALLFIKRLIPQITYLWSFTFVFLGLFSIWAIPLIFGRDFLETVDIFLILVVCLNLSILNILAIPVFVSYDMVKSMVLINFGASIMNLLLDLILVPRFGIVGAACATTCAYGVVTFFYYTVIKLKFDVGLTRMFIFQVMAMLCLTILFFYKIPVLTYLMLIGFISFYFLCGKALAVFNSSDKDIYGVFEMPALLKQTLAKFCDLYA